MWIALWHARIFVFQTSQVDVLYDIGYVAAAQIKHACPCLFGVCRWPVQESHPPGQSSSLANDVEYNIIQLSFFCY